MAKAQASQAFLEADILEEKAKEHARTADMLSANPLENLASWEAQTGGSEAAHRFWTKESFDKCDQLRKKAKRIMEVNLPHLGDVLAAYRTQPMEAILGKDHAVVD